ncbi:hypothetical protein [Burkholderia pseudomallei]|uniref:hypothetical protein n=1 Tax=Burkholderia pseudomallei TaxID=28450 RepID=UPI001AAFDCA0|nr:hypothetical protein [Burkholderia pseudomallei]MBO3051100.1 hypothetical protein [Burkholderia pseudomallei]
MKNATARRLYIKKSRMMKSNTLHIKPLVFHVATALAALQGGFLFSSVAWAAPTGSQVVAGSASIGVSGATTIVNQGSNRAIINWKNFNVGSGETVRFIAPNTASATLNRVVGSLPSSINGLVQGNGRVFLINPNGILVGQGGAINVQGGFVASTGNISDSAFMQGGAMVLSGDKGQIQVLGTISASGGDITLIAPAVAVGAGATLTAGTKINLVAADQVMLSNGNITVMPGSGENGTVNVAGTLKAAKVMLAAVNDNLGALAINTTGMIQATGTATNPDGSIQIVASGGGNVQVGGTLQAQNAGGVGGTVQVSGQNVSVGPAQINVAGTQGGTVTLTADPFAGTAMIGNSTVNASGTAGTGGMVQMSGHNVYARQAQINVSGTQGGTATFTADPNLGTVMIGGSYGPDGTYTAGDSSVNASGTSGNGGHIDVTGYHTALMGNTLLNANGTAGGGRIRVGGDMHGQGTDIANATDTYVDSGVNLNANGTQGNASGGKVVVWANDTTNYYGSLTATGSGGGQGGTAEVSGHLLLNFRGKDDLLGGSNGGIAGTLLLDPSDLTIDAAGAGTSTGFTGAPTVPGGTGPIFTANASHISWQDIVTALGSGNVLINTNTGGGGAGNITIAQGYTYNSGNQLTLEAFNNLTVNAGAAITNTGNGSLTLAAQKNMAINANLTMTGGQIWLQAGAGLAINTGQLSAGPGSSLILVGNVNPYTFAPGTWLGNSTAGASTLISNTSTNPGLGADQVTFNSGTATPVILQGGSVYAISGNAGGLSNFLPGNVVVEYGTGNTGFGTLGILGFGNMNVQRWNPATSAVVPDVALLPTANSGAGIVYFSAGGTLTVPTSLSAPNGASVVLGTITGNIILQGNAYTGGPTGQLVIFAGRGGYATIDGGGNAYANQGAIQFAGTAPTVLTGWDVYLSSGCNTAANCASSDRTVFNPSVVLVQPNNGSNQFQNFVIEGFQNMVVQDVRGATQPILASSAIREVSADNLTVTQNLIVGSGGTLQLITGALYGTWNNASNYSSYAGALTFTQPDTILQGDYVYLWSSTGAATAGTIPTGSQATWQGSVAATEAQLPNQGRVSFDTPTNQVQLRPARTDNTFSNLDFRGFNDTRFDLLQNGSNTAVLNTLGISNGNFIDYASGNIVLPQGYGATGVVQTLSQTGGGALDIRAGYDFATGESDLFGELKVLASQPLWSLGNTYNNVIWSGLGYNTAAGTVGRIDFAGGATGGATPSAADSGDDLPTSGSPIILQAPTSGKFSAFNVQGFGNVSLYGVSSATTPGSLSWSGGVLNGFNQAFAFGTTGSAYVYASNNLNLFNQNFQMGNVSATSGVQVDWRAGYNLWNYDTAVKHGKLTFMDPATLAARTNLASFQPGGADQYLLDNNQGNDPGSANDLTNLQWDWTTGGINYVPMSSNFQLLAFRNVTVQTARDLPIVLNGAPVYIAPNNLTSVPAIEGDVVIVPNMYVNSNDGTNAYTIVANSLNTQGVLGANSGVSATVSGNDFTKSFSYILNLLHNPVLADGVTPGNTSSVVNVSADTSSSVNSPFQEEWVNLGLQQVLAGNLTVNSRGMIDVYAWGNTTDTSNITIRSQGDIGVGADFTRTGAGNLSLQADANLNNIFSGYAAINPIYTGSNTDPHGYDTAGADGKGAVFGYGGSQVLTPRYGYLITSNANQTVPAGYLFYTLAGTPLPAGSAVTAGEALIEPGNVPGGFTAQTTATGQQVFAIYAYTPGTGGQSFFNGYGFNYASLGTGTAVNGVAPQALTVDAGLVTNAAGQANPIGTVVTGNTGSQGLGLSGQFYVGAPGTSYGNTGQVTPLAWTMLAAGPRSLTTGTGNIDIRSGDQYQNTWWNHLSGDIADMRLGANQVANQGLNNPVGAATWFKLTTTSGSVAVAGYRDITVTDAGGINPSAGTAPVSLVANRDLDILGAGLSRATMGSLLTLGAGNMIVTAPGAVISADQLQLIVGNGANIVTSVNSLSGEIIAPAANPTGVLVVNSAASDNGITLGGDTPTGVMSVTNGKTINISSGFTNGMLAAFTFGPNGLIWPAPAPYGSTTTSPLHPVGLSVQSAGATLAGSINVGTTAGDINVNAPILVNNSPGITTGEINLKAAGNLNINNPITDSIAAPNGNIFLQAVAGNITHSGPQGGNTVSGNNLTMIAGGSIGTSAAGGAIDTNVNAALFQSGGGVYIYQSGPLALTTAGTANGTANITDSQNTLTVGNYPAGTAPQTTMTPAITNNVYVNGLASAVGITDTGSNGITLNAIGATSDVVAAAHTYTPNGAITVNAGRNIVDTPEETNYGDIGIGTDTPTSNRLAFSAGGTLMLNAVNTIGGDGTTTPNPLDVYFGNLTANASGTQARSGVYLTALDTNASGTGVVIGGGVTSAKNIDITARASTTAGSGSLNVASAMTTANGGYIRLAADRNVNVNAAVSANTTGNVVLAAGLSGTGNINQSSSGTLTSGSGEINANAAGNINWNADATTTGNILAQSGQAMTYGGNGTLNAASVALTSGTTIGTAAAAVQTNTGNLAVVNGGDAYVNNAGAVTLAGQSSNNAGINVSTTNGTITVGKVNVATVVTPSTGNAVGWDNNPNGTPLAAGANLTGVNANGSGNVVLTANGTSSNVLINQSVTSGSGAITATADTNVVFNNGVVQTGTGATGIVNLNATNGQVIDNEAASKPVVIGNTLNATAANGIGTVATGPGVAGDLATQIGTLNAVTTGTGNAVVQNNGALNVMGSVGTNTLNVGATGAITVSGPIAATGGTVDLTSGMSAMGSTVLANNTGGVTLASDVTAGTLSINSAGLVQQTAGSIVDKTLQVSTTRYTTGNSATLSNDSTTLTENGSTVAGNYTITTQGTLNQTGTTTVGGNLTESGQTGGTVNGTVTVGGNYSGVNTYGPGGNITAAGSNSWTNANASTTGVVVATGAGPDFDLASANLGSGNNITVDLRSKNSTVSGATDAILLNGSSNNELGTVTLNTANAKVAVTTTTQDYNLVQTAPVNVASLTVNAVAGTNANAGLQNNGLGVINGINYGTHDNALNGGQGSRIALQSSGNSIGAITIGNVDVAGVSSSGNITINNVMAANGLQVTSTAGSIQNGTGTSIVAPTLALSALNGIGTAANPINYDTATVMTATGVPGVLSTTVTGTTGNTFVSASGPVQLGGMVNTIGFTCNSSSSNVCNPATTSTGTNVTKTLAGNGSGLGNITLTAGGAVTTGSTVTTNGGNIDISNSNGNITLSNAVTAASKGNIELTSAANLLVNANVNSAAGEINAQAMNNVALGANVSTAGNVFIQAATQAITQSAGTVSGKGVVLTAGTTIGTATNTIQLNSSQLALQSPGSAYATEAGPTTVAGQTTANGKLYVATTNGNLTVGSVSLTPTITGNAPGATLTGLNANGSGTIEAQANGGDLNVNAAMVSGTGEINAKSTGGNVALGANITTAGNAFVEGNQAITYTAGTITAKGAVLTSDNGSIGASGVGTVQTAVNTLGVNSAGDAFVNNAGAMTVAAESANNGSLNLSTTNGTITVGSVALTPTIAANAAGLILAGVSANGTGDANLSANGAGANILVTQSVTSGSGAINAIAANNVTFNNGVMQTGTGASGIVTITATAGQIVNNESPAIAVVTGNTLNATAANGIGTAAAGSGAAGDLGTQVSNLDAVITGTGNAVIQNNGALNVAGSVGANMLSVGATDAITVSGPINAAGGTVNLTSGMAALGSTALSNNAGGVTLASDVTTNALSISSSGLVKQTSGSLTDTITRVDTTRFTTGNSATLSNNATTITEAGSTVAGNYTINTQGTLNQTGATTVGGNLTESGETGGTVNGTVNVGGNYDGVNNTAGGGSITAGGSSSAINNNAAATGVVTATGQGPDFDLSSVNLSGTTLSNVTVNLRAISANVTGATDAVLLNTGNNALGSVTITTANAPVTVTTGLHDFNLVQTAAVTLPTTTSLTVNAVAGASTPAQMQNNGLGTISGINYNAHDNTLNGGQGSRIVLNNPANTFAGITINNADAANVATSGNLQLGAITVANSMVATSVNGSVTQKATVPAILASALALNAATGIGATNAPIRYDTATAIAAGDTPVLATSESGAGSTSVSTTGAVQLGGAINEVGFDSSTSNVNGAPGTGTYIAPTLVSNTATTGELNLLSNGTATLASNVATTGNAFIQAAAGNIVQTGGTVSANGAVLTANAGGIGSIGAPIAMNVGTVGLSAQGDIYAVNAGPLTMGAVTSSNGAVNVSTTNGTLTVGAVNLLPKLAGNAVGLTQIGVNANGNGAVNLTAGGAGSDLLINQSVISGAGAITGTADSNITFNNGAVQTTTSPTGVVTLTATNGQVIDNEAPSSAVVTSNTLNVAAASGIGAAASAPGVAGDLATQVGNLAVTITGTGNAVVQNNGALNVSGSVGSNTMQVGSTGAITVAGPIQSGPTIAYGGTLDLTSGMTSLGSTGLSNNKGGVTLASNITVGTLSINSSGLVQQTAGLISDNTLSIDTTRFTTGNSASLTNGSTGMTDAGSNVAGNYTISTQGSLDQTGTTTVGGNLTETGYTGGTVNGTVKVGGNYDGVNNYGPNGSVTAGGSNSATNANAASTGVVVASGSGPDFDLSSVTLTSGQNVTVDLRSTTVSGVGGATDAVLLNAGANTLGTVTVNTAKAPVTLTKTTTDYNLVQTSALDVGNVTVNAVAGANTAASLQNNTLGTIAGSNYDVHNNALNGGQGSRIVLDNTGNTLGNITINNGDAANVASSGSLQLNAITVANSMVATSQNGTITQVAGAPAIKAGALALNAATGIGASNAPLEYDSAAAVAAGKTPILATSESGNGSTAVATTGAVQLGGTINEVGFDLTNSNLSGATGTGTMFTATAVNNSADTGEINLLSNGWATLAGDVTTSGNAFIQATSGNIVQTAGTLRAADAVLTALGGSIGSAGGAIATNVQTLGMDSQGSAYAVNSGALNLGAMTTSNGTVNVTTQNGPLTVTSINVTPSIGGNAIGLMQNGVSANGSGNVVLQANGGDLNLNAAVTSGGGEVNARSTAGDVLLAANVTTTGNAFVEAANNVTQTNGTLAASGAVLTADKGSIGSASQVINTAVNRLGVTANQGSAYVSNAGAMTAAGTTQNDMVLSTGNGQLTVGAVALNPAVTNNAVGIAQTGITTGGDLSLLAAPTTNGTLQIDQPVNVGGAMIGVGGRDVNVNSNVTANGAITFVADATSGPNAGPGWFRNTGNITSNGAGVAIYAVAGGKAPLGYSTTANNQVILGTVSGVPSADAPASRWSSPYGSSSYIPRYFVGNGLFYKASLTAAAPVTEPIGSNPVTVPGPPNPPVTPAAGPSVPVTGVVLTSLPVSPSSGTAQLQYGGAFTVDLTTMFDGSAPWQPDQTAMPYARATFDASLPINGNYAPPRFTFGMPVLGPVMSCTGDEDRAHRYQQYACIRPLSISAR